MHGQVPPMSGSITVFTPLPSEAIDPSHWHHHPSASLILIRTLVARQWTTMVYNLHVLHTSALRLQSNTPYIGEHNPVNLELFPLYRSRCSCFPWWTLQLRTHRESTRASLGAGTEFWAYPSWLESERSSKCWFLSGFTSFYEEVA